MLKLLTFLFIFLSCSDYTVTEVKQQPELIERYPDITIEIENGNNQSINIGCPVESKFVIKNIGTKKLVISNIALYASVPVEASFTGGIIFVPIVLDPEETYDIPFSILPEDFINDTIMIMVESDDPDESQAMKQVIFSTLSQHNITDNFTVNTGRMIDLLMVVDNSSSMSNNQAILASNALYIINGLNTYSSDYQIGVITTDNHHFVGPLITSSDINAADLLEQQIRNVGIRGSSFERGIKMSIDALADPNIAGFGSSFSRQDSKLAIIWISDENDHSFIPPQDALSSIWSAKPSPSDVVGWAIVGDWSCGDGPGLAYIDLAQSLGGSWNSICDESWQATFESLTAVAGTQTMFNLSNTPLVSTINVTVNGIITHDWVYVVNYNAVSFNPNNRPSEGDQIVIEYAIQQECF